jgi:hypothetical protein
LLVNMSGSMLLAVWRSSQIVPAQNQEYCVRCRVVPGHAATQATYQCSHQVQCMQCRTTDTQQLSIGILSWRANHKAEWRVHSGSLHVQNIGPVSHAVLTALRARHCIHLPDRM